MRQAALSLVIVGILGNLASGFSLSPTSSSSISSRTTTSSSSKTMPKKQPTSPFGVISPSSSSVSSSSSDRHHRQRQPHAKTVVTAAASVRGGGSSEEVGGEDKIGSITKFGNVLASFWAAGGVSIILLNSIRRIVPIAMEPFRATGVVVEGSAAAVGLEPLTQFQLAAYILTCIWFAYVEGYKGFQRKFSPMVVSRSQTLKLGESPFHHFLFGPFYAMGLFHATKKRMIVSWGVTLGVAAIVVAVKRLPYPWRNIVDAGVVVGLSWGTLSILLGYVASLVSGKMPADAALPEKK